MSSHKLDLYSAGTSRETEQCNSLVEDVLFGLEVDLVDEVAVDLLLELLLELLCRLHAVLGRAEDAACPTLLLLGQLHHLALLEDALDEAAGRRDRRLLLREAC